MKLFKSNLSDHEICQDRRKQIINITVELYLGDTEVEELEEPRERERERDQDGNNAFRIHWVNP